MKQPHTEQTIDHTDGQQNTGNHKVPGAPDAGGADKLGGTRAGAENVEGGKADGSDSVETGTDVDKVGGLDGGASTKAANPNHERSSERDEHGRL